MPTEHPIACTLTAAELAPRLAAIRAVGRRSLRSVETDRCHAVLRFSADAGTRERLEAIVAAEARCCAFLDIAVEATAEGIVLTLAAPPAGESAISRLVESFRGRER